MDDYVRRILTAKVYDVARETPLDAAQSLSRRIRNQVLLKREDLQPVYSFKLRGAYNMIVNLSEADRARGVITASAGNHAQGVALAARHLGVRAVIVMPRTTPSIKVDAVRAHGAKAVLEGDDFDAAFAHTQKLVAEEGLVFIPPFDHPDVIAGQGTIAVELMRQHRDPIDAIFVPVGGGGLIAGIAAYFKSLSPQTRIIGVEPDDAASMHAALRRGRRVRLKQVGIFADGAAVREVGREPFRLAKQYVDEVLLVDSDEICAAIKDIFDETRAISEPAGALALAGLKRWVAREGAVDRTLVAINSGANMNFDRLRHVSERAEIGERREALLAVTVPERPGSFRKFCRVLGRRAITEFNYRYSDPDTAQVFAGIRLSEGDAERKAIVERLEAKGYPVLDLTDNEMAKLHMRYMVGGRAPLADNEMLYRFEFPERPGALLEFLLRMGAAWNISLFHYRNHGAADGRVLIGMQVPPEEKPLVANFLEDLGYPHWEETQNPAYRLFLA
ncbi:threonine ammonia-lyase, biosynthetic [Acidihalobacter prosperus]|uniref:L-threonine dehydratase n=1 Tax=Acidihalobacter prosperus TaxID=160660 RepID=A0A1A6C0H0_9GAMM|nr:threonine ammonia-lyase, biosynthetic [Acidihalobacter prosperus]OBS08057.1 PLP-dependent threonine dehydratase [Acidihalobacter prosperus]